MLKKNTMQSLKVLATLVDEKARVDTNFVKVSGAQNISQGHLVLVRMLRRNSSTGGGGGGGGGVE